MADIWYVTGNNPTYQGELFVRDESSEVPIQQESFELMGAHLKVIIRGYTLGHEGSFTTDWNADEVDDALTLLDYLGSSAGPHLLENPFGESFYVTFGEQDRRWLTAGRLEVELHWIEIGNT